MTYLKSKQYRIPGMIMLPGKTVIPGANTVCLVPVMFDQDVNVTNIGFSCAATVASGKAQCAIYASDPATRFPVGTPITTAPEATCATAQANGNFVLAATWTALKDTLYYIAVIGSTSAVGFNAGHSSWADNVPGNGMGDETVVTATSDPVGAGKSAGFTYATSLTWLDLSGFGIGLPVPYAPMLWFKTAAS